MASLNRKTQRKIIKDYRNKSTSTKKPGKTNTKGPNAIAAEEDRRQMLEMLERDLQTLLDMMCELVTQID